MNRQEDMWDESRSVEDNSDQLNKIYCELFPQVYLVLRKLAAHGGRRGG